MWTYVQREDGKPDVAQLGKGHPEIKERYVSHLDKLGPAEWLNNKEPLECRPTQFFYAKRCPVKNTDFNQGEFT